MKCQQCNSSDEFYVILTRAVKVHTVGESVLDLIVDDEQFVDPSRLKPFACANCGSTDIDVENKDIDAFWGIYNQRVDRKVLRPKYLK